MWRKRRLKQLGCQSPSVASTTSTFQLMVSLKARGHQTRCPHLGLAQLEPADVDPIRLVVDGGGRRSVAARKAGRHTAARDGELSWETKGINRRETRRELKNRSDAGSERKRRAGSETASDGSG